MSTLARIDRFLEEHLDAYIDEAAALCAQPSVSARGEGVAACADLVGAMLAGRGVAVERYDTHGFPILLGRLEGTSERTLLFYNHYDVQPPEPLELWDSPPFEPEVRDGALYARGAKDDKGELVARLAAIDAVREAHGGALPCNVLFVIEGEEEIGSPHIVSFVHDNYAKLQCQGAIWEEGGTTIDGAPLLSLGCRGVLALELSVSTMRKDAHSGNAHALPNAAWRLTGALASLKAGEHVRIAGFYDHIRQPSERDNALFEALPDPEPALREGFGVRTFVGGARNKALSRAVFTPTCNIEGLRAGYQGQGMKTVIPADASAKLDFRLVPDQDPEDILAKLRAHLDLEGYHDVAITPYGMMWPYRADADHPFMALAREVGEEVYRQPSRIVPMTGGSSPIYAFHRPLGIPVVSAGVGYGNENRTHAPNEHVRLEDFLKASKHIARIVERFAGL